MKKTKSKKRPARTRRLLPGERAFLMSEISRLSGVKPPKRPVKGRSLGVVKLTVVTKRIDLGTFYARQRVWMPSNARKKKITESYLPTFRKQMISILERYFTKSVKPNMLITAGIVYRMKFSTNKGDKFLYIRCFAPRVKNTKKDRPLIYEYIFFKQLENYMGRTEIREVWFEKMISEVIINERKIRRRRHRSK